jgi:hypothetical protein
MDGLLNVRMYTYRNAVVSMYNSMYVDALNVPFICYVLHKTELRICLLRTRFMHVSCDLHNKQRDSAFSAMWDLNSTSHSFKFYSQSSWCVLMWSMPLCFITIK